MGAYQSHARRPRKGSIESRYGANSTQRHEGDGDGDGDGDQRLRRLCKLVKVGYAEMDDPLHQRIGDLQEERDLAQSALERARNLAGARTTIAEDKIAAIAKLMRQKLSSGDTIFRKNFMRSILGAVEVHPDKVSLLGSKDVPHAAIAN